MNFGSPRLLWLLLLAPALLALVLWSWRVKQRAMAQFIGPRLLESLTIGLSKARQKIRAALFLAAVALVLFALARPRWGFDVEEARQRGLDVVVAIDTSKSMLADDIQPNRLTRAKLAALDLMKLAKTDRLGLVAFAGSAFLQCPLSLDEEAFRQSIELLDVNIIPQGGTALTEAIQTALSAFKEKTENHKILVLFTDGEDHDEEGTALAAAREAAREGLRIFTIGVGTPGGELLSTTDPYGNRVFVKDDKGNVVKSRLNEALLQQIAKATEGFYLPLAGARTMEMLYDNGLAPLPKAEFAARTMRQWRERFPWFIGAAIVLLLAEMLLPERVRNPKSSVQNSKPVTAAVGIVLLVSATHLCGSVNEALKAYERGRFGKARDEFERLTRKSPDDPRLRYNAGAAAFQDGDYQQALKHFSASLSTPDLKLQEKGYYNLGNTHYRLGERAADLKQKHRLWEQAVHHYENALKLDANDADAQFNLELVKQKIEELKQQQQQQQEQNQQDKNEKQDDQQKDQQNQEKQDEQSKPEQKSDGPEKSEQQKKEEPSQEQQKQDQAQDQPKEQDQQSAQDQRGQEPGEQPADGSQSGRVIQMTPQQAMQLLEAQRAEEKTLVFQPQNLRTNRSPQRVFRDW